MKDLAQQLQESLGSTYSVERELGGGGMSRVFVATETALRRRVVIKVLTPELAQGLSAERFAREIQLAAALQEPHIVPVLATGNAGGLPYFTMPYVEGESLRTRLLRGEVSYGDAIGILRDVALALEYAHARGIVHRDIKPENVLLSGRTAVVADFGIAKAVSAARTMAPGASPSGTLTSIGQSLGTPAYMAPEQATGDPVDSRADLYAWGIMAYELLAGRHPFADKASTAQLMAAQVMEKPVPLSEKKPGLPPPISALVMQCIEKDPGARPENAIAVVQGLDGLASPGGSLNSSAASAKSAAPLSAAAPFAPTTTKRLSPALPISLGVVALSVGVVFFATRKKPTPSPNESSTALVADSISSKGIAVLPFENLGDSTEAYFADGITDAVRTKLVGLNGIRVIARGSSNQYRATQKLPSQIAKELGVRYLLSGAVRFAKSNGASRVQVTPELVELTGTGQPESRWTEAIDAEVKDVFKVQGDIASKVASAMQVALGGSAQAQLATAPTESAEAYDAYLRAQAAWNFEANIDARSLRNAMGYFAQAVARDPKFVEAWGALSRAQSLLYNNGGPDPELKRRAFEAAQRALSLDSNSGWAHRALSTYYMSVEGNYRSGLEEAEKALRASPNEAILLGAVATAKEQLGRFDEAYRDRQAATALDPRGGGRWNSLATNLSRQRRFDEARKAAERALSLTPNSGNVLQSRVLPELGAGRLDSARQVLARARKDFPEAAMVSYMATYWDLGWVLTKEQEQLLLALGPDAFDDDKATWAIVRAQQYGWRGEMDQARAWGDTAVRYFRAQLKQSPADQQLHVLVGLALAYAGKKSEAVSEVERGIAIRPIERGGSHLSVPYFEYQLARVHQLNGDPEKAIDVLERVLSVPYFVSKQWLLIEPTWKDLRGNSRFQKLTAQP
jgi:serine/threonine-protein kinase